MSEGQELVPADAALATEIAQIEHEIIDRNSGYWRSEERQSRYRQLLDARESGKAAPKADPRLAERLEIEKLIGDRNSAYWRGPGAERMQDRYRSLLAAEANETPAGEGWRTSPAQARPHLDPALVAEWEDRFAGNLRRAQDMAVKVVGGLSEPESQEAFKAVFDFLPRSIQTHVIRELARPEPGAVALATDQDMNLFRCVEGAGETLAVWGRDAPRKVAIALDKFIRIENSVTPVEKLALKSWWDRRTPRERQLVMFGLGS
jgi:hypothetical protein